MKLAPETLQLVRDALLDLPSRPAFSGKKRNVSSDDAHRAALEWSLAHPKETGIVLAALAGAIALADRERATAAGGR